LSKKFFYVNGDGQLRFSVPRFKPHPLKTLIQILNANASSIRIPDEIGAQERADLAEFVKKMKEAGVRI